MMLLAPTLLALSNNVLVVDDVPGPGVGFTSLQAAVDAAAPGDTVLVREGHYISTVIDGKGVVLTAELGATVRLNGRLVVRNVPAGAEVLVRGVAVAPAGFVSGLFVEDCDGSVWLERVSVDDAYLPAVTFPALEVRDSSDVTLVRSSFLGNRSFGETIHGGPGGSFQGSNVHVYDTVLRGGDGSASVSGVGLAGPGVQIGSGRLYASGATLRGGDGGFTIFCTPVGDGGAGIELGGGSPLVRYLGAGPEGGAGGMSSTAGCTTVGSVGPDSVIATGELCADAYAPRSVRLDGPLRSGAPLTVRVTGEPGDVVLLSVAAPLASIYFGRKGRRLVGGVWLPDPTADRVVALGTIDVSGTLQRTFPAPPVVPALTVHAQAIHFAATSFGEVVFSSPASLTVLDSSF